MYLCQEMQANDKIIGHTAFSSSSKKLRILCCLISALLFLDDVNVWGVHPAWLFPEFNTHTHHPQETKKQIKQSNSDSVKFYPL